MRDEGKLRIFFQGKLKDQDQGKPERQGAGREGSATTNDLKDEELKS